MIGVKLNINKGAKIFKNLTSEEKWNKFLRQFLENFKNEFLKNIKMRASTAFENSTGGYIAAIKGNMIGNKKLVIESDHPAVMAIEYGFPEERPMTWLIKPYAISFDIKEGKKTKTITRRVREQDIGNPANNKSGKSWTYPVMEGKHLFEKSFEDSMRPIGRKFRDDIIVKITEED